MNNDDYNYLRLILQLVMAVLATFGAFVMWGMLEDLNLIIKFAGGVGLIVIVYELWKDTITMINEFRKSIKKNE